MTHPDYTLFGCLVFFFLVCGQPSEAQGRQKKNDKIATMRPGRLENAWDRRKTTKKSNDEADNVKKERLVPKTGFDPPESSIWAVFARQNLSHFFFTCCAATAVPHLVQPLGTDSLSRCRSLALHILFSILKPLSVLLALVCFCLHCVHDVLLMPHRCESPAILRHSGLVSGPWRILRLQLADRVLQRGPRQLPHQHDNCRDVRGELSECGRVFLLQTNLDQQAFHSIGSLFAPTLQLAALQFILFTPSWTCLTLTRLIVFGCCFTHSLDLNCLVVVLDDGYGECHVHLHRVSGHVFDEILVPWCNNDDGAVPLVRAKLFLSVNGGHSMLPFLLLAVHVEPWKQCEGRLA